MALGETGIEMGYCYNRKEKKEVSPSQYNHQQPLDQAKSMPELKLKKRKEELTG
jgi:hypothetical protein